jgi:Tol biopolymer transport system component/predicted Ser/Thr protein kinase
MPHRSPELPGYAIRRELGVGGMGVVYLAHEEKLGRNVAVKVLSPEVASDHARVRRFEQEARAASALSHPNVCVVYALGETAGAEPFIAMEYIEGQTLRELLQHQPPTLRAALDIAIQIAAGVGAAHGIGIVHRDLKPENAIVRQDGLVKVLDFGLAKLTGDAVPGDEHQATRTLVKTETGVVMGTYTYMAPEQARGQEVDARADIWALGVILYELVSGHAPFTGATRSDVLVSILEREAAPLDRLDPRVPHELQRIVAKTLRKDRAQRYQTITDLRLDLEALRGELQASSADAAAPAVPAASMSVTPPPLRRESSAEFILTGLARHKLVTVAGLIAVIALVSAGGWYLKRQPEVGAVTVAPRVERNLTRLTYGAGLQTDPTLSPDGRFLAFASDRAGNFDIWVQPVAGGDPVQVTSEPEPDTQPAWSPDGSTILFRSEHAGGGLFAVPALGGPRRQLATLGEWPTWSRNGTEVLFRVGSAADLSAARVHLFAIPADGGSPQELAAAVLGHGNWKWIAEHPDGRISAAGTHDTLGVGFFTFSRSGENLVKSNTSVVPAFPSWDFAERCRFIWNRAGTRLYVEATVNLINNLWRVEVNPATLAWQSAERLTTGPSSDINAVLSADESRIVYAQQALSMRLWSFPFNAAEGRLTGDGAAFSEEGAFAAGADLSSDGAAAVYNVGRPGGQQAEIWLHRFDGSRPQLLIHDGVSPKWLPGGNIAYTKWRKEFTEVALLLREPNGTERQLSPWRRSPELEFYSVHPGGHSIFVGAYTHDSTPLWLWSLDRLSEKPEKVILDRPRTNIWQAQISPNGRWLAFIREVIGAVAPTQVVVARMDVTPISEWAPVAPTLSNTDKPRWTPDGRVLYFLTTRNGYFNLGGIRFDPDRGVAVGQPFEVTHFTSPSLMVSSSMGWSEIGISAHRAVLPMVSSTGSVWMLDNVDK